MTDKLREALENIRSLVEETWGFASASPRGKENLTEVLNLLDLLCAPSAEPVDEVELLKGWKLNHIQFVRGSGTAEIGYLDAEDDRFSPVVTVDTGLYYQPQDAVPLARAILDRLAAPLQQPQEGWVSVDERLPEKFVEVLVAFADRSLPSTGQYTANPNDHDGWCYPKENCDWADGSWPTVTHWRPLPDHPHEERFKSGAAPSQGEGAPNA